MPDKSLRMRRAGGDGLVKRPVMLAIAGDSAAGKTTMTRGLVEALGPERCVSLCTDDYHRYDREERKELPALGAPDDPGVPRAPRRRPQRAAGDRPAPAALPPDGRGPVNAA